MKTFGNVTLVHKGPASYELPVLVLKHWAAAFCFHENAFLLTTMKADSFGSNNDTILSTGRLRNRNIGIPAFIWEMNVASGPDDIIVFLLENHPEKGVIALIKPVSKEKRSLEC